MKTYNYIKFSSIILIAAILQLSAFSLYGMEQRRPTQLVQDKIVQFLYNQSLWVTTGAHFVGFAAFKRIPNTITLPFISSLLSGCILKSSSHIYLTKSEVAHHHNKLLCNSSCNPSKKPYTSKYLLTSLIGEMAYNHPFLTASVPVLCKAGLRKPSDILKPCIDLFCTAVLASSTAHDFLKDRKILHKHQPRVLGHTILRNCTESCNTK